MPKVNRPDEKHGMYNTKIYAVWENMIARCEVPTRIDYKNYGARGISVCKEWRNSFIQFHEDMRDGYDPKLRIDRIDNNGHYCKDNCRWVTTKKSLANRRSLGKYLKGVYKGKRDLSYHSKVVIDGIYYGLGSFDTEIKAHNAYKAILLEWYGP